jgi:hypothetical protein
MPRSVRRLRAPGASVQGQEEAAERLPGRAATAARRPASGGLARAQEVGLALDQPQGPPGARLRAWATVMGRAMVSPELGAGTPATVLTESQYWYTMQARCQE